jgi:lipopolysaccharide/colanic/teichoic acid biosynthesis glycosyltransferase
VLNTYHPSEKLSRMQRPGLGTYDRFSPLDHFSCDLFHKMLVMEKKRTERSNRGFILLLVDFSRMADVTDSSGPVQEAVLSVLSESTRETDLRGWYETNSIAGAIFTEIDSCDAKQIVDSLRVRITSSLNLALAPGLSEQIVIRFLFYPEDWDSKILEDGLNEKRQRNDPNRTAALTIKRVIDICGSVSGLVVFAPIMLAIAAAIKLTSNGPVLFRQVRIGQYGKPFTFLKFRSMYVGNDHKIHEEYTKKLITGELGSVKPAGDKQAVYKIVADPRVTAVGKFLRKSSLDELPQFINILMGEMSLVGPRPPVTYEFDKYALWHRQRLHAAKPGLTGLWQVEGRSSVSFDEMVRLDIRYARSWSLWLDIQILLRTPGAVIHGSGAY